MLVTSSCAYCDAAPEQEKWNYSAYYGAYLVNGIDRVDNNKGYEFTNCVACCRRCNLSKNNMPLSEWKKWVCAVYARLAKS